MEHRRAQEAESSVGTPAEVSSVVAAGAIAAAKEQCRTMVLETQDLAKKLTKPEFKRMADSFAEHAEACVSTSGSPLSMFASDTWPKCFVEFFYGDAVPQLEGTRQERQRHNICAHGGHLRVAPGP